SQRYGRAAVQRDQTRGSAGGGIEISRARKRRSFGSKRNFSVTIRGIGMNRQANLVEIGKAIGLFPSFLRRCQRGQQQGREDGQNGDDDEKLNQGEPPPL